MLFVTLPPGLWETLFGWLPSTASQCQTTGGCQVPLQGVLFYVLVGASLILLVGVGLHRAVEQGALDGTLGAVVGQTRNESASDPASSPDEDADSADEPADPATLDESRDAGEDATEPGDESRPAMRGQTEVLPEDVEAVGTMPADGHADTDADGEVLDEVSDLHQRQVAPSGIRRKFRRIQSGQLHRQVLFAHEWPDQIPDGVLQGVFTTPDLQFDLSLHISPRDRQRAQRQAENRAEALQADAHVFGSGEGGGGQFTASDKHEEAKQTAAVRDAIKNGEQPFDVSLYVSPRGDSEDDLREQVEAVRSTLADAPANLQLRTVAGEQDRALQSVSPIGRDVLADEASWDPTRVMLGTGVGAVLGSATDATLLEETGVELGEHAFNGSPVIKDPFKSETNYNWTVIGDSGGGKSYTTKLQALRTVAKKDDTMVILLDPLKGFVGLAEALGAQTITVGGDQALNPLELRETPDHVHQMGDEDPLSAKIKSVMSFFENFAYQQGLDLGGARTQLQSAVVEAYERNDFTHDPATHSNESPTITDVLNILQEMADKPEEFVVRTDEETETIRQHATTLLGYLRPFEDGQYTNLAEPSEFDIRDEDFVYISLNQQESSGDGGGLMTQLLFSLIYERAKETPKDVVFLIDEARYLMKNAKSLEFLGQRVRHSRHFDTSIRFITQNIRDFFGHEEAESIINNTFIKVFHRTEEISEWADQFGLNAQQVEFIENANAGEDNPYSEALVEINSDWYPVQIFSTPAEHAVVDFDEQNERIADLPGMATASKDPVASAIEDRLQLSVLQSRVEDGHVYATDVDADELAASWADQPDTRQALLDLLNRREMEQALEAIAEGRDATRVVEELVAAKLADVEETVTSDQWASITADLDTDPAATEDSTAD